MRDLTASEKLDLRTHGCIFCMQRLMWLGPQGGLSFNIYCTECLAGFNVTHTKLPWQVIAEPHERLQDDLNLDGKMDVRNFFAHLDDAIERGMSEAMARARGH